MYQKYVPPEYGEKTFACPKCEAYTQQEWHELEKVQFETEIKYSSGLRFARKAAITFTEAPATIFRTDNLVAISICVVCEEPAFWIDGKMVYPKAIMAPLPNPDMPENVKAIYNEARALTKVGVPDKYADAIADFIVKFLL